MELKEKIIKLENENNEKEDLIKKINDLNELLKDEKNKNDILSNKIKELENKNNELQNNLNVLKSNNNLEYTNNIIEKDKEIKLLKSKLERYPFELEKDEKLISVIFISNNDKELHCSIICKNTDKFCDLEKQLYNKYPKYRDMENYYLVNDNRIKRFKSLIENKIENSDIITLNSIE